MKNNFFKCIQSVCTVILGYLQIGIMLLCPVILTSGNAAAVMDEGRLWAKIKPLMEKGVEIYTSNDDPESRTVFEYLTLRDSKIQEIIEDCLVVLGESVMSDNISEINRLGDKVRVLRKEIHGLRLDSISLPESSLIPLKKTKKSVAQSIAKDEEKIVEYEAGIDRLKQEALNNLKNSGLNISEEQLEYLFVAPNGTILSQLMSVAGNIKTLVLYIERQLGKAGVDSAQAARTYTGLYFIGCRTHVMAFDTALSEIDKKFLPRLNKLRSDAEKLVDDTKILLNSASEGDRATLETNLSTTISAIKMMKEYGFYLKNQRALLLDGRKKAESRLKIAVNSLKTVNICPSPMGIHRTCHQFHLDEKNLKALFAPVTY